MISGNTKPREVLKKAGGTPYMGRILLGGLPFAVLVLAPLRHPADFAG